MFKLCKYLETLTGKAHYGEWAELMIYNGVGGSIQMDKSGKVQYFSNYSSRGGEKININPWSCCTGTRPQAVADYTDLVYFHRNNDLYVNLFLASTVNYKVGGSTVSVMLDTRFPAENSIRLKVQVERATSFTIFLRSPEWIVGQASVSVDGKSLATQKNTDGWIPVSNNWTGENMVELTLPIQLRWSSFEDNKSFPGAVTYGPVVLALLDDDGNPALGKSAEEIVAGLVKNENDLVWTFKGDKSITARPWYLIPPDQKYYLYLDPTAGPNIDADPAWHANGRHQVSDTPGSKIRANFSGTGVRWNWTYYDDAGIADVIIDGKKVRSVDQYNPRRNVNSSSEFTDLTPGNHQLTILHSGRKNPASSGMFVNSGTFETFPAPK